MIWDWQHRMLSFCRVLSQWTLHKKKQTPKDRRMSFRWYTLCQIFKRRIMAREPSKGHPLAWRIYFKVGGYRCYWGTHIKHGFGPWGYHNGWSVIFRGLCPTVLKIMSIFAHGWNAWAGEVVVGMMWSCGCRRENEVAAKQSSTAQARKMYAYADTDSVYYGCYCQELM